VHWLFFALLAGLLILLAIPVDLEFSLERREGRAEGRCGLGWLFGVLRVGLCPRARARRKRPMPDHGHPRRRAAGDVPRGLSRRRSRRFTGRVLSMLRTERFVGRLLRLAGDLIRSIRVRELGLDLRLGLDDPADTGRLWAVVGSLAAIPALPPNTRLAVVPCFTGAAFEMEGQGRLRVIPLQVMAVILAFVLSPATLRALLALRGRE
jgi:hypothetical protein